jgi:glycosyltransferase involved in cell wall biosynthesis
MLGAARNTGLRAARGKYVWFIDSDDYIKENCLGKLLEIAERNELEILHFNAWQITDEGKQTEWEVNFPYNTNVITGIDYLNIDYPYWKKHGSTWSKIFLNDFLKKNNLFFPESVFFEDGVHSLNSILLASRFLFDTSCIYFYRINENSITSFKNLINNGVKMADRVYCCCACMDLLEKYKKHPFAYNVREVYIYLPLSLKKSVLYLPLREKLIFYKKINSFDRTILWKYMRLIEHFVYTYPLIMIVLSILPISILRPIRTLKRKIMNSDK